MKPKPTGQWGEATSRVEDMIVEQYKVGQSIRSIASDYGITTEQASEIIYRSVLKEGTP